MPRCLLRWNELYELVWQLDSLLEKPKQRYACKKDLPAEGKADAQRKGRTSLACSKVTSESSSPNSAFVSKN